ncbi:YihY/virulence factor BrkB family protein [Microbacterium sp. SS28]|uniref:YihY/virulence factor BrkB family protein n=1 Tax=Microbacterium sp. SS28 TaxID=2919948 RepID=UPI001FAAE9FF|nr:YihY/virulence factor BrkB family protein [Microbacterium sp. SS28]
MTVSRDRSPAPAAQDAADAAAAEEEGLRRSWDQTQAVLRERFEPRIEQARGFTQRTMQWFPIRVWMHFLHHNGFLLAAGVSYQALFASFAAIYVGFAIAGLWLGASPEAIDALIGVINTYIPGLIGESGLFTEAEVTEIATSSATTLGITGIIALGTLIWTAIGFVTFARRGVRDIFGLPPDLRSYFFLKARDLIGAVLFALALILGSALTSFGTWAMNGIITLLGLSPASGWSEFTLRIGTIVISFVVYTGALAGLIRFLTGTRLAWRRIWPGALLGGGAITVLQLGTAWLFLYTPSNSLLAAFAIFVGLLLWFRIIGVIMLVAAAWVAVSAHDNDVPLMPLSDAERLVKEHEALLLAAQVRLRTAKTAAEQAPWYRKWTADKAVRDAVDELQHVESVAPPPLPKLRGTILE